MDSTDIPVYGEQEESVYNGHFEFTCYLPLLLFYREGDCRGGQTAARQRAQRRGWEELLLAEIERQQRQGKEVVFRAQRVDSELRPRARSRDQRIGFGRDYKTLADDLGER